MVREKQTTCRMFDVRNKFTVTVTGAIVDYFPVPNCYVIACNFMEIFVRDESSFLKCTMTWTNPCKTNERLNAEAKATVSICVCSYSNTVCRPLIMWQNRKWIIILHAGNSFYFNHNVIECITWHCHFHANHMLLLALSLSYSHFFAVLSSIALLLWSQLLLPLSLFSSRKSIYSWNWMQRSAFWMHTSAQKKLHRATIFMKYATVAENMTRRGKTSHTDRHTHMRCKNNASYNSNDTIGMLFVLSVK